MAITSGDKVFYYQTRDSLCFLTMTEAKYPKRLAFLYLDEVCDIVLQELVQEFGGNVSSSNYTKTRTSTKPIRVLLPSYRFFGLDNFKLILL